MPVQSTGSHARMHQAPVWQVQIATQIIAIKRSSRRSGACAIRSTLGSARPQRPAQCAPRQGRCGVRGLYQRTAQILGRAGHCRTPGARVSGVTPEIRHCAGGRAVVRDRLQNKSLARAQRKPVAGSQEKISRRVVHPSGQRVRPERDPGRSAQDAQFARTCRPQGARMARCQRARGVGGRLQGKHRQGALSSGMRRDVTGVAGVIHGIMTLSCFSSMFKPMVRALTLTVQ